MINKVDTVLDKEASCKGSMEDGGSAVIIATGTAFNPDILERKVHFH